MTIESPIAQLDIIESEIVLAQTRVTQLLSGFRPAHADNIEAKTGQLDRELMAAELYLTDLVQKRKRLLRMSS